MNKLKLHLEDLQVDTFQVTAPEAPKGTVFGEQCTCYTQCTCPGCPTCENYGTCDASCNGTCEASCNGTCDASCNGTCAPSAADTCGNSCAYGSCYNTCDVTYPGFVCSACH